MKSNLAPEQSQRLIELGIDPSKASAIRYNISETEVYCGYAREIVVVDGYIDNYLSKEPIFTLTDILSLLPKKIEAEIQNVHRIVQLEVRWNEDCWLARYSDLHGDIVDDKTTPKFAPELIDALYELLCWVLKNHPSSIKQKQ